MKKEITVREWNELKSILLETREGVLKLIAEKDKESLTPDEACEKLGISRSTYQRRVKEGAIRQIKQGDKPNSPAVVERSHIEKLLSEGRI